MITRSYVPLEAIHRPLAFRATDTRAHGCSAFFAPARASLWTLPEEKEKKRLGYDADARSRRSKRNLMDLRAEWLLFNNSFAYEGD
ncbi:hypothetical protein L596_024542 [Steinernema carpocapsae]|uniref:Uncharacterized protein n=1 Tax=Steinernema carpocapsae TaxID=34508 RepID=A0A4U5MH29_STECR|nr:hypothetical protein L596_024542 [Steinernema carpocapsae]